MRLAFHKNFVKAYSKLDARMQNKVDVALGIFCSNPLDKKLLNHTLKGALLGKRAIKVTADMRIIFEEIDDYIVVILLDVGTHNQVY